MIDLRPFVSTLDNAPVAVLGLGLSGMACVRACIAAGATVHAWDDDVQKREKAKDIGATINDLEQMEGYACLILSPGIPLHFPLLHPVVENARAAGVEIIGDIELLHRANHGLKTIGITGTNGKSTTTALIGHILTRAGLHPAVGGNIGTAVMDMELSKAGAIVLELSSYQLDLCVDFSPDIAVHLNLSPDHIDRHGDMQGYIDAKMRIFKGAGDAVIGIDDKESLGMMARVQELGLRHVYGISSARMLAQGVYVKDGLLYDVMTGEGSTNKDTPIASLSSCSNLLGVHNHQNAAAAYAVCRLMGIKAGTIMAGMESYPGLAHRMFLVRSINGIAYINDSKATNADAAGKALASYRNIYWILGGRPKAGGLDGLEPLMERVHAAFVIGEAASEFSAWLKNYAVTVTSCADLKQALKSAHHLAQASRGEPGGGGVVLLSPACASFDQFRSFEHRGEVFTDLVMALPDTSGTIIGSAEEVAS